MPADLHIHTIFSDGTHTPEEIVEKALQSGLSTIAISDHDAVEGIPRAEAAARNAARGENGKSLEIIPAIEMNAETETNEVHVLGYFIDWEANWFQILLKDLQMRRRRRIEGMVQKLKDLGLPIEVEQVFQQASEKSVGRPHIARVLVEAGLVTSFQDAFNRYLAYGKPAYVKGDRLSVEEAIHAIKQAGGVPVLAHPGVYKPPLDVESVIPKGIEGIEIFYNEHDPEQQRRFKNLCNEHNLLMTGGSDFHGDNRPHRTLGSVQLDDTYVTLLKERQRKNASKVLKG